MPQYIPAPVGDRSPGVAIGGLRGQYLRKASDLDGDTDWEDVPAGAPGPPGPAGDATGLPVGGDPGSVLMKTTGVYYDANWVANLDGGTFN